MLETCVPAELQALRAPFCELPARRPPNLIDLARVDACGRPEMYTRAILPCRKTHHTEVPWLHGFCDVLAARLPPADQVFRGNQNPAVGAGSTAGSAGEAVEVFGHRPEGMLQRDRAHAVDFAWQP